MRGNIWSKAETARLLEIVREHSVADAARAIGRTPGATHAHIMHLRSKGIEVKTRGRGTNRRVLSSAEVAWLRTNVATMSHGEMAKRLGVAVSTLRHKLHELDLVWRKYRPWSPDDNNRLAEMAGIHPVAAIALALARSKESVITHAAQKSVSLSLKQEWTDAEIARVRELAASGRSCAQIAREINRSQHGLRHMLIALGIETRDGRVRDTAQPKKQREPRAPRAPKAEKAPKARRTVIGSVAYCPQCSSPVVNTFEGWIAHNARIHPGKKVA